MIFSVMASVYLRSRRCPHSRLRGIYGDEINATGGYRLACEDCGRVLEGPVNLAKMREREWKPLDDLL